MISIGVTFYDEDLPISRMSILNNFNKNKNNKYYYVQAEVFLEMMKKLILKILI